MRVRAVPASREADSRSGRADVATRPRSCMAADPRRSSAQADFWNPTGRDRDGRRKYHRSGRQGRLLAHQRGGLRGRGKVEGNCLGSGPLRRDVVVRPGRMSRALFGSARRTSSRTAAPTASGCGGSQPCPASGRPAPSGSGRGTAPPPAAPRRWRDPTADPVGARSACSRLGQAMLGVLTPFGEASLVQVHLVPPLPTGEITMARRL
jgi:hypothetical protein